MTTRFFEDRLRLLSLGCRLSFTIMTPNLDGVTPQVQTINNGPIATCTGHFIAGGSIKFRDNRWVLVAKDVTKVQVSRSDGSRIKSLYSKLNNYLFPSSDSENEHKIAAQLFTTS
ncbi:hypothetical protein TNCV_2140871 [Trichonephila clavipes]|uniref:Uncharacterized protein n=1 Tax=Trichonephila clavipes TaxID=2585209 RepID=A0A8X6V631_TRICX|nr:hypothetical protein TNCV_2140871 [Trichonephila clavipes]